MSTSAPAITAVRVALDGDVPPAHAALLVRDDAHPFALAGRWFGAQALAGSEPVRVAGPDEDPFALLDDRPPAPDGAPPDFVGGGWAGYLGFGLGRLVDVAAPSAPTRERLPGSVLAWYDHVLRLDAEEQWWFEALWTEARAAALDARLALLQARLTTPRRRPTPVATAPWRAEPSPAGHARAVAACRERIAHGDLYQANLSLRLRSTLLGGGAADLFTAGASALRPDRAAYLEGPWGGLASLSPELFLTRHDDRVVSAPIKGTRPRAADSAAAAAARADLLASEKDRAENTMIVDLVRNDLGRVSIPGSVRVRALADVRPHPGVWHLVSEVEGRLVPGTGDGDLLRATFPPGSVTGAPKRAAIDVIAELESAARQVFTGAIGLVSPVAGLELNVAIRTFEVRGDAVWLDVGGGIVADSEPDAEAAEALVKARPLLRAIGAELALPPDAGAARASQPDAIPRRGSAGAPPAPLRRGPRPLPRPDPAAGVFETLLVRDGAVAALDAHVARLTASLGVLYGAAPPADLAARARAAAAAAAGPCRLRLLATPDGTVDVETAPLPPGGSLTLVPVTVPGGLGPHKWRDRRLLDALTAAVGGAPAVPLLVDLDGALLEAAWANVLLVDADGAIATPPLDGRILPGLARAAALADARTRGIEIVERRLTLTDLAGAHEVLLTSALRGAVAATVALATST